jgi:hypothetical protein
VRTKRLLIGLALLWCVPAVAPADQYFVNYEADAVYPEDCGWTRRTDYGGAVRGFEDGALVLDSRASIMIDDSYSMLRPGALDPGPGEVFVMEWRLRVDALQGPWDPRVGVYSDDRRAVFLDIAYNAVWDGAEGHVAATFEGGANHEFAFRSWDMATYGLYIDGALRYEGEFTAPLLSASKIAWGDGTQGGASLCYWDYFRYGVVPEPRSTGLALVACLVIFRPRG